MTTHGKIKGNRLRVKSDGKSTGTAAIEHRAFHGGYSTSLVVNEEEAEGLIDALSNFVSSSARARIQREATSASGARAASTFDHEEAEGVRGPR